MSDYLKYRGKCKEICEEEIKKDPTLTLVRGVYICPMWGKQTHWWCIRDNGEIFDPTVKQFPTAGYAAEYIPFTGIVECSECGKELKLEDSRIEGNYTFCSYECHGRFVGIL